jgi:hypothetical protein
LNDSAADFRRSSTPYRGDREVAVMQRPIG